MDDYEDEQPKRALANIPGSGSWVETLAFEVALEYFTPEDLQLKFELSPSHYEKVVGLPDFRRAVADYRREIDDEGLAFKLRARKGAEAILSELYDMAFDRNIEAKDRLKAMELMCKYAGFDTKQEDAAGGVKLQIFTNLSLNNGQPQQTYTIEVPHE